MEKKIALAMIVKGTKDEAQLLEQCLANVSPHVDGLFITSTYKSGGAPSPDIDEVCKKYGANVSYFEWVHDFSAARNFNFSQVPKDYDYILWCDADDVFRGLEKLLDTVSANPTVDVFAMWYLYSFDEHKLPNVVHKKAQVIRNDGTFKWYGSLHEEVDPKRQVVTKFIDGIERLHMKTDEGIVEAKSRNVVISKKEADKNPDDPRVWWNLANSYFGAGKNKLATSAYKKFLKMSGSDDEKYLAHCRIAEALKNLGHDSDAHTHYRIAIGMKPDIPDAYYQYGLFLFERKMYDNAERYIKFGLILKPQYHNIIVYNPRDYDYNPMMMLAKVYFQKGRPDLALPMLEACLEIYPDSEYLKGLVKEMTVSKEQLQKVVQTINDLAEIQDKDEIIKKIDSLPEELRAHPKICQIRNKYVIKESTSGKDIAYYCGQTIHEWNPELFKTKGFGGSEEAVVNLAREWSKMGYNVTVYNSCGPTPMTADGVVYKPYWMFNPRDKWDITIMWRTPIGAEHLGNYGKLYVDLHDVISEGDFTPARLEKIHKIFVKTHFHRSLFPNIPDDKFLVIPNGQDFSILEGNEKKDQYLMVNTSSPDRSMDVLPKLFKKVKERVPQARLKWAYGWDTFDQAHSTNSRMMEWKQEIVKQMEEAGVESVGRLSQKEVTKLYREGNVLAYPSEFAEIDCISVKKAQACGCIPVTSDFGAFAESVQYGVKIPSTKTKDTWAKPFQIGFGIESEEAQNKWIDEVVKILQTPIGDRSEMKEWSKKFSWDKIASQWLNPNQN